MFHWLQKVLSVRFCYQNSLGAVSRAIGLANVPRLLTYQLHHFQADCSIYDLIAVLANSLCCVRLDCAAVWWVLHGARHHRSCCRWAAFCHGKTGGSQLLSAGTQAPHEARLLVHAVCPSAKHSSPQGDGNQTLSWAVLDRPGLVLLLSWQTLFCGLALLCVSGCNAYEHYRALDVEVALPLTVAQGEAVDEQQQEEEEDEDEDEEDDQEESEDSEEEIEEQLREFEEMQALEELERKEQGQRERQKQEEEQRQRQRAQQQAKEKEEEQRRAAMEQQKSKDKEAAEEKERARDKPRKSSIGPWKQKKIAQLVPA